MLLKNRHITLFCHSLNLFLNHCSYIIILIIIELIISRARTHSAATIRAKIVSKNCVDSYFPPRLFKTQKLLQTLIFFFYKHLYEIAC